MSIHLLRITAARVYNKTPLLQTRLEKSENLYYYHWPAVSRPSIYTRATKGLCPHRHHTYNAEKTDLHEQQISYNRPARALEDVFLFSQLDRLALPYKYI